MTKYVSTNNYKSLGYAAKFQVCDSFLRVNSTCISYADLYKVKLTDNITIEDARPYLLNTCIRTSRHASIAAVPEVLARVATNSIVLESSSDAIELCNSADALYDSDWIAKRLVAGGCDSSNVAIEAYMYVLSKLSDSAFTGLLFTALSALSVNILDGITLNDKVTKDNIDSMLKYFLDMKCRSYKQGSTTYTNTLGFSIGVFIKFILGLNELYKSKSNDDISGWLSQLLSADDDDDDELRDCHELLSSKIFSSEFAEEIITSSLGDDNIGKYIEGESCASVSMLCTTAANDGVYDGCLWYLRNSDSQFRGNDIINTLASFASTLMMSEAAISSFKVCMLNTKNVLGNMQSDIKVAQDSAEQFQTKYKYTKSRLKEVETEFTKWKKENSVHKSKMIAQANESGVKELKATIERLERENKELKLDLADKNNMLAEKVSTCSTLIKDNKKLNNKVSELSTNIHEEQVVETELETCLDEKVALINQKHITLVGNFIGIEEKLTQSGVTSITICDALSELQKLATPDIVAVFTNFCSHKLVKYCKSHFSSTPMIYFNNVSHIVLIDKIYDYIKAGEDNEN